MRQLGTALKDGDRWAVFAIREDYLAPLDPYLPMIPNRLSATFRLDLLGRDAAIDPVRRPAEELGVAVEEEAVKDLIDDLDRIQVMDPLDGSSQWKHGNYVEPLHLQVVCESLWRERADAGRITRDDLKRLAQKLGDESGVSAALTLYYNTSVRETAEASRSAGVTERSIRKWIDRALISPAGLRISVLLGGEASYGLNPAVLHALTDRFLIRRDQRQSIVYYELAHDRLIGPARKSNADWLARQPEVLFRRADRWEDSRRESDLLHGKELEEAVRWSEATTEPVTQLDKDFLARSLEVRDAELKAAQSRRLGVTVAWLSLGLFVALVLIVIAVAQTMRVQRLTAQMTMEQGRAYCEQGEVDYGMLYLVRSLEQTSWPETELQRVIPFQLSEWRSKLHTLEDRVEVGKPVWALSVSPDGRKCLTSGDDGQAQLWDATTGKTLGEPMKDLGPVRAMAFSPDGKRILTGSKAGPSSIRDARSGRPSLALKGPFAPAKVVAFSRDGRRCLAGGDDHKVRVWDAASGEPLGKPIEHPGPVLAAAMNFDGTRVVTGGEDGKARLWDADSGGSLHTLKGHEVAVKAAAFSDDGKTVITGSDDGKARLWDADSGQSIGDPIRQAGGVTSVAFGHDGKTVVTGSYFGVAQLWDGPAGRPLGPPLRHGGPIWAVAFSRNGEDVLTGGEDGVVRRWHPAIRPPGQPPLRFDGTVTAVAFSPDGKTILTGDEDGRARLWDLGSRGQPLELLGGGKPVKAVAFSPDGKTAITGNDVGEARLWDTASGQPIKPELPKHDGGVIAVAFSRDGKFVLTGYYDTPTKGTARVWNLGSGRPTGPELPHGGPVWSVAFGPDGTTVATGSGDGTARLWDAASGRPKVAPIQHHGPVWAVALSPDGRILATGDEDRTARLWDTASGRPIGEPLRHRGPVRALAFGPAGQTLLTGCNEYTAQLWDVSSSQRLGPPLALQKAICAVAFDPQGRWVATASVEMATRWDQPPPLKAKPHRIDVWLRVVTGLKMDPAGGIDVMDDKDWRRARDELEPLGGPP